MENTKQKAYDRYVHADSRREFVTAVPREREYPDNHRDSWLQ